MVIRGTNNKKLNPVKTLKQNLENGTPVLKLRYLFVVVTTAVGVLFVIHILKFQTINSNKFKRAVYLDNPNSDYANLRVHGGPQVTQKLILMWTPFFNDWTWLKSNSASSICPLLDEQLCQITTDHEDFVDAHAVLFHWSDVKINKIPKKKESHHKWILINYEPPTNVKKNVASSLNSNVDWTVSYRLDSDFNAPYGRIRPRLPTEQFDKFHDISQKEFDSKDLVAWAVSHCHTSSQREKFVERMRQNVTIYQEGTCPKSNINRLCPRGRNHRFDCYRVLAKRYKFYLSFENSLCQDYVTEKFFLPLKMGMVPVVMGGADYAKIAPKGSYINALDFETPEDLAIYLKEVGKNITLYKRYFDWTKHYVVDFADLTNPKSKSWICDICSALHGMDSAVANVTSKPKKRKNLHKWWFMEGNCWSWPSGWEMFFKKAQKRLTNTLGGPFYKFIQG